LNLGTAAADTLSGTAGNDRLLFGLAGNDAISGLGGNDMIYGGAGKDVLNGGAGLDTIAGGLGRDLMTGGAGADDFRFNAVNETTKVVATRDVIKDFAHGVDKINLKAIDASSKVAGDQAFKFIGTAAFHKMAGELHVVQTDAAGTANDVTVVQGDTNGDGVADFHIELTGLKVVTATDFVL
jgi:serralysin